MFARIATRVPITAAFAGKRAAPAALRYNSSSSSSRAARVIEIAAQAERPSGAEAGVPALWAVCGALTYAAWNRMNEQTAGENVEKLLIV
ncbi:uncharacterized protein K460DRAFT_279581 [Cucurbitaria berberidis CBS 394.84]|uniref:Uncharacterized protein n=1 Tax=Cucurbitaria berberidis CBS 394.84 TaxID=1168544 RepID=A0A9P4LCC0_9PLEO|nr:uncharacterized protein K460DRAFT_279581 [Cucurbitaria berberidis CBS 394.84]KAF1849217.1 hypothetical protein K460DRAFT_279581 [Cucurbitaria berberidis CBS 394.84]